MLDLHMPGLDGFETGSCLAKNRAGVPVVVITGYDTPESQARAIAGGASAYLCKPIDARILLEAIRGAVRIGEPR